MVGRRGAVKGTECQTEGFEDLILKVIGSQGRLFKYRGDVVKPTSEKNYP